MAKQGTFAIELKFQSKRSDMPCVVRDVVQILGIYNKVISIIMHFLNLQYGQTYCEVNTLGHIIAIETAHWV